MFSRCISVNLRVRYDDRRVASPFELAALAIVGVVAGTINVVAGGGSFLTIAILLFFGLPAGVANATNRVGVLLQNITGLWGFHRSGALDLRWAGRACLPALAGAGLGAWLALRIPDFAFTRVLSTAMLAIAAWSIWSSRRRNRAAQRAEDGSLTSPSSDAPSRRHTVLLWAGFFLTGIYGGFIQAGVGFFILGLTSAAGLDLIRGNAIKLLSVLLMTLLSLAMFGGAGTVDWGRGLALGLGNAVGGLLGVRLAVLRGQQWLEQAVTAAVVLFAVLLWLM